MKISKRIVALVLAVLLVVGLFAGCSAKEDSKNKVAILQFMPHPSLDNCTQGVVNELKKAGIEYDIQIGSSANAVADCDDYAKKMAAEGYSAIVAVATPAAMSAYSAVKDAGVDIPVIFCAVSDPVGPGLVKSMDKPGTNCTGTADAFDIVGQINLIKELQPSIKKLGVIYTTTEANSLAQLKTLEAECKKANIELVSQGINDATELPNASATIVTKVDAITNLTDNNVVDNMPVLLEKANAAGIPVYGSEIEQVKNGCLASASLDYVALGEKTGVMCVDVVNGKDASTYPAVTVTDSFLVINSEVASTLKIDIPDSLKDVETVTTNK